MLRVNAVPLPESAPATRAELRESTVAGPLSRDEANNCGGGLPGDPYGDRAQARRRRRLAGFRALDLLATFSTLDRVKKCRRVPSGSQAVEVRLRREEGRAHFSGVQTCGSVWACPCCSERILAGRAEELLRAIKTHAAAGGDVLLLTLTMRHEAGQGLAGLWDALGEAWRAAYGSKGARIALTGCQWVRRVEVTHGGNGWHVHVHALLFTEPDRCEREIGAVMFDGWRRRLVSLGLGAPLDGPGMTIKRLDLIRASAEVAEYLAKGHYEAADRERLAALELASTGKAARSGNRTPMQILADFVGRGLAEDAELWREWEQGSKGRRALTWSRGARRALLQDEPEASDDELAAESDGGGQVVALIDAGAWPALSRNPVLMNRVLNVTETAHDAEEAFLRVDALLAAFGLAGATTRPPPVSE